MRTLPSHRHHDHDEEERLMDQWHDFFLAQAGAAGVLTGLVFVAVSINLQEIVSDPGSGLPGRAAEALILLVGVLTASILLLVPGQGQVMVGAEVLVVGLVTWGSVVAIQLRRLLSWGTMRPDLRQVFVLRVTLGQIATIPLVVAGITVLAGGWEVCTGLWRAWSSRSWWLYSRRGCCSSRSTGRRSLGLLTSLGTLLPGKGSSEKYGYPMAGSLFTLPDLYAAPQHVDYSYAA
jgi:hypothetical protein